MRVRGRGEQAMILIPGKKSTSGWIQKWKIHQIRPGHIVTEELGHVAADDGDNDSFASADDIGVLHVAFDDAIDNLTRFNNFQISLIFAAMYLLQHCQ